MAIGSPNSVGLAAMVSMVVAMVSVVVVVLLCKRMKTRGSGRAYTVLLFPPHRNAPHPLPKEQREGLSTC